MYWLLSTPSKFSNFSFWLTSYSPYNKSTKFLLSNVKSQSSKAGMYNDITGYFIIGCVWRVYVNVQSSQYRTKFSSIPKVQSAVVRIWPGSLAKFYSLARVKPVVLKVFFIPPYKFKHCHFLPNNNHKKDKLQKFHATYCEKTIDDYEPNRLFYNVSHSS